MREHSVLALFLSAVGVATSALAADFTGPVTSVFDGDTIEVLHSHHPERIRLSGIDCPEKGQAYGQKAKQGRLSPGLWPGSHASDIWQ